MIEIGIFQNGASDLKTTVTADNVVVNEGSLKEVHESYQRVQVAQIRQGILAEQLGFDYWFMTEHHFMPEGPEFSPNPLLAETAIAANTKRIRLAQMANILPWWHPIRIAEQAAMLDVISGGRLEFGIGRGYQPREAEVFGRPFGSTVQDQERNRAYYHEAYELILKAWTEPSFSHHGQFFTVPPTYTKWHHKSTMAYFNLPQTGYPLDSVLDVGAEDVYATGGPSVLSSTTTLNEISVFPQPIQKPHPQIWEPLTSERSIKWAVQHGVNGFAVPEATEMLKKQLNSYYEEAERCGWPDRLNRGQWKFGWDAEKHRGFGHNIYMHIVTPGPGEQERVERYKNFLQMHWDYFGAFGLAAGFVNPSSPDYDPNMRVTPDVLIERGAAIVGTPEHCIEEIMNYKEECGYEDLLFVAWLEAAGFTGEEIEEQMHIFASEVVPTLKRECGGGPSLPESTVQLVPNGVPSTTPVVGS
jgi:alkanesulfonate monooxygenase SsuD/methylene tetrahydromethanopterin reductase-like flavin-dependent oxidoreductase (luciferase family)